MLMLIYVIAVFKIIESPEKWSAKDDPNHERIVKTPIGVYKKVCLFARSLVYISLRVSGCPVCTFCILFLKKILTFTKRRFRDYSAITVRLQAITVRLQAITVRLQTITVRLQTITSDYRYLLVCWLCWKNVYKWNNVILFVEMVQSLSKDLRWRVVIPSSW